MARTLLCHGSYNQNAGRLTKFPTLGEVLTLGARNKICQRVGRKPATQQQVTIRRECDQFCAIRWGIDRGMFGERHWVQNFYRGGLFQNRHDIRIAR